MSLDGPIDIVGSYFRLNRIHLRENDVFLTCSPVEKPAELNFQTVRKSLMRIVPLCLDSDPSLIPLSCKRGAGTSFSNTLRPFQTSERSDSELEADNELQADNEWQADNELEADIDPDERDPDDFSFWSEKQAERICWAVEQAFGVEYAPEVVVADANLTTLANRILLSKEMLTSGTG